MHYVIWDYLRFWRDIYIFFQIIRVLQFITFHKKKIYVQIRLKLYSIWKKINSTFSINVYPQKSSAIKMEQSVPFISIDTIFKCQKMNVPWDPKILTLTVYS